MATLEELLSTRDRDAVLDDLLQQLADKGFPVTDWHTGGVARTLVEIFAEALADFEALIAAVAKQGFLDTATGKWLDLVALSQYGLTRKPATFAKGNVTLSAEAGMGPYEIQPGQLWVATQDGLRFSNTTGGTLPQGGTLILEVQAESPGAAYNVPAGTITVLLTPLPGVSVTNPSGWLTSAGADEETDEAFRERCKLRWAEIGQGGTRGAYVYWALSADPAVRKVKVLDQPRGQGTVDVVLWGEGGLGADVVDAVNAYIQERRPLTVDVQAYAATEVPVAVQGTVFVRPGYIAQAQAEAVANLAALQRSIGIGEPLYQAAVIEAIMAAVGVVNVELTSPAADVYPQATEVITLTDSLTWQEI